MFDTPRTGRFLWVIPSVLLHLLVLAAWLQLSGDTERRTDSRKMVLRSDQAEELKQFVEDANLKELHSEVRRLQEIKRSMAGLRAEQMSSLEAFAAAVRDTVDADAGQTTREILALQDACIAAQEKMVRGMEEVTRLFEAMQPDIESRDLTRLLPAAQQLQAARQALRKSQDDLDRQFLQLQARADTMDVMLSWMNDPTVTGPWADVLDQQKRVLEKQSYCSDQLGQAHYGQAGALANVIRQGADYPSTLQRMLDEEREEQEAYASRRATLAAVEETTSAREQTLKAKVAALAAEVDTLRRARTRVNQERSRVSSRTPEGQAKRASMQKELTALDRRRALMEEERRAADAAFREARNTHSRAGADLRRLRPPSSRKKIDRERLVENMDRTLSALNGQTGDLAGQQEAVALQQEARQSAHALLEAVTRHEEARR